MFLALFVLQISMSLLLSLHIKAYYFFAALRAYFYHFIDAILTKASLSTDAALRSGGTVVSTSWVRSILSTSELLSGVDVPTPLDASVSRNNLSGGLASDMFRIKITWPEGSNPHLPVSVVVKTTRSSYQSRFSAQLLGSAREGLFYQKFGTGKHEDSSDVWCVVPRVYNVRASWSSGNNLIVMEDLALRGTVAGGQLFGNQCWGPAVVPKELEADPVFVLERIFLRMADIHATYWRDQTLLKQSWLKHVDWLHGQDRVRWEIGMVSMKARWEHIMKQVSTGATSVKWDPVLTADIDKAAKTTSWTEFGRRFDLSSPKTAVTLCHGDFHANNMMWRGQREPKNITEVYMIDWPEVGMFCPFTDLAQFLISNASPALRRKCEMKLLKLHHDRLIEKGVDETLFPFDECVERYKVGGQERWMQMLILIATIGLPEPAVTWFHDQVAAFVHDHAPSTKTPVSFVTSYCMPFTATEL
jgi:thiamine kinase-like enzyme